MPGKPYATPVSEGTEKRHISETSWCTYCHHSIRRDWVGEESETDWYHLTDQHDGGVFCEEGVVDLGTLRQLLLEHSDLPDDTPVIGIYTHGCPSGTCIKQYDILHLNSDIKWGASKQGDELTRIHLVLDYHSDR